jgi:hypothetical protein
MTLKSPINYTEAIQLIFAFLDLINVKAEFQNLSNAQQAQFFQMEKLSSAVRA